MTQPTPTATMTLAEALEHTYRTRWAHARDGGKCLYSQAKAATGDVADIILRDAHQDHITQMAVEVRTKAINLASVQPYDVQRATAKWYAQGLSPATITKRLNCLSAMGVKVSGMRPAKDRKLKWWLRPEEEERAHRWLDDQAHLAAFRGVTVAKWREVSHFIAWTTKTGLRVEETLRLRRTDFSHGLEEVTVPGTKTAASQANLPLDQSAHEIAVAQIELRPGEDFMWTLTYGELEASWRALRDAMAWPQAATLKALRRSAARYLHVDCGMPLDLVRAYLRHESINTTLGYLRLTGGYSTEEMRRYLK